MLHRNTSLPLLVCLFLSLSLATSTNYIATETTYTTNLCNPNNIISSYEHSTNCTPYDGTDNKYSLRLTCKIETNEVEMIVFHGISCQGDPLATPTLFALDTCLKYASRDTKWTCTTINDVSLSSTEESVAPTPTSTPTPATFSTAPSPTPPTQTAPSTQTLIPVPAPAPATTTTSATTTTTPQPQKTLSATTTVSPFLSSSSLNSNTTTNTNTMALNPGDETILDTSDAYSDEHISSKIVAVLLLCWVINLCIES